MAKKPNTKKNASNKQLSPEFDLEITANLFPQHVDNVASMEIAEPELLRNQEINTEPNEKVSQEIFNIRTFEESQQTNENNSGSIFSINIPIYLEIHKANLLQYVSSGLFYPSKYSKQNAFSDPQSFNKEALLLSNGQVSANDNNIIIELNSTAIDSSFLTIFHDFALYSGIIPLSRIVKIYVPNAEVKSRLIDDSLLREGGYIPEKLLEIGFPRKLAKINYVDVKIDSDDLSDQVNLYNRILGLISGVKNFNLLTFNSTSILKTISDHCFFAIQAMQNNFAVNIIDGGHLSEFYKWLFSKSCPDDRILLRWIFNRINEDANFTDTDTRKFSALCLQSSAFIGEEHEVNIIFSYLSSSTNRKKSLNEILKLNSKNALALYIFAYLRIYATRQSPELARTDLVYYGSNKYSEYAFAVLNFFFGYKQLRNSEDRLKFKDERIEKVVSTTPAIKFKLNSLFDYKVIDIVFKQSFINKLALPENNYSQYLNIEKSIVTSDVIVFGFKYSSEFIYGKEYQKLSPISNWEQFPLLDTLPQEISIFSEMGLFCYRLGLPMKMQNTMDLLRDSSLLKNIIYFSKNDLKKIINEQNVDKEELNQRISLALKHNEFR